MGIVSLACIRQDSAVNQALSDFGFGAAESEVGDDEQPPLIKNAIMMSGHVLAAPAGGTPITPLYPEDPTMRPSSAII